jgi:hypothetical protein
MAGYSDDEFGIPGIPSRKTTGSPSKDAADQVKSGNTAALAYPNFFPGQGGSRSTTMSLMGIFRQSVWELSDVIRNHHEGHS